MDSDARSGSRGTGEGQVIVLFALFSLVLVGVLALAVDVGYLLTERREAQNIADAAAIAGAHALWHREGETEAENTAQAYATLNGAGTDTTVISNAEGDHNGGTVTVTVQQPVQKFFLGAIYTGDWEVSSRAVAAVIDIDDSQYALAALDHNPGMYVEGDMTITIHNGSAMSNGDVQRSGSPNIFAVGGAIDAVGAVNPGPSWVAPDGFHSDYPELDDPLVSIPPPPIPGTVITAADIANCMTDPPHDCILKPGYYKDLGQIIIKRTAALLPGPYYFEGTSIFMEGSASRITDNDAGVMLYFAEGSSISTTYFDPANSSGGIHLTAPATSPYTGGLDGMTVWIDNCSEFNARGGGEFYIQGVFYAPCSDVRMHGNPLGDTIDGQVIVGNLTMHGGAEFSVRYHNYFDFPRRGVFLQE